MISRSLKGLHCRAGGFHIDPTSACELALITHAHSDHARRGSRKYLCVAQSVELLQERLGHKAEIKGIPYGEKIQLGEVTVSFHPAGHILGSAQIRIESKTGEVWVVSGDYKRDDDPTCAPFEVVPCDTFITEATFGLPIYQWEPVTQVATEIYDWWQGNAARGINSLLFCYSLGKSQRVLAELLPHMKKHSALEAAATSILVHDTIEPLSACYRIHGVELAPSRTISYDSQGEAIRGALILAPPGIAGTPLMRRIGQHETAFASGWMRNRGSRMGRRYDRSFALSDHADWPSLVRTVRETGARHVYVMHADEPELVHYLRKIGIDAHAIEELRE